MIMGSSGWNYREKKKEIRERAIDYGGFTFTKVHVHMKPETVRKPPKYKGDHDDFEVPESEFFLKTD